MKKTIYILSAVIATSLMAQNNEYIGAIQFTVQEKNPELLERSQNLVKTKFIHAFSGTPFLKFHENNVRVEGSSVIISIGTQEDLRKSMAETVNNVVHNLTGYVEGQGDFQYYRIADSLGNLHVKLDDSRTKIQSVIANEVPLADLLEVFHKKLNNKKSPFIYAVSKPCGEVNISVQVEFEDKPITIDEFLKKLSKVYSLNWQKTPGPKPIYVFTEDCHEAALNPLQPIKHPVYPLFPRDIQAPMQVNFLMR